MTDKLEAWPPLPIADWQATRDTLHMCTQIVGKIRLALSPKMNHWWEVPFYLTARGLTTSPIPYGTETFEILFDFIDHQVLIETSAGATKTVPLAARPVADFYAEIMSQLNSLGITVKIWTQPSEVPSPVHFDQDRIHSAYDPAYAQRFWRVLVSVDSVFKEFRARFLGKSSPVHFFWGSFDLAVTRFSGRRAPERPGADTITREAYSHEVISVGWWLGGRAVEGPAFYCSAAPEPAALPQQNVQPESAFYHPDLKEFILMYDDVRTAASPKTALMEFLQSTYAAAADCGSGA